MEYGYCRISRKSQKIERQIQNIKKDFPNAIIFQEAYTGTKITGRKEFNRLLSKVTFGDTIIFDSVSRMSRNAEEGISLYFDLFDKGISLIFIKESYINTDVYKENLKNKIALSGTDEDEIFIGLNNYFRKLAERQIRIAFEQSEKEVTDLRQRTKEGIREARRLSPEKQFGQKQGAHLNVKKKQPAKNAIKKYSKYFDGTLNDSDVIKLVGLSRNTFYKYKKELFLELS